MKHYNIFLDDERMPIDAPIELPPLVWTIIRSYDEFTKTITNNGLPQVISFDHDMDVTAYQEYHRMWQGDRVINYSNIKEKTGYHCAQWLVEYCRKHKQPLPAYYIHSYNDIGRENIAKILQIYEHQTL